MEKNEKMEIMKAFYLNCNRCGIDAPSDSYIKAQYHEIASASALLDELAQAAEKVSGAESIAQELKAGARALFDIYYKVNQSDMYSIADYLAEQPFKDFDINTEE